MTTEQTSLAEEEHVIQLKAPKQLLITDIVVRLFCQLPISEIKNELSINCLNCFRFQQLSHMKLRHLQDC